MGVITQVELGTLRALVPYTKAIHRVAQGRDGLGRKLPGRQILPGRAGLQDADQGMLGVPANAGIREPVQGQGAGDDLPKKIPYSIVLPSWGK